jgi:hypothetical protein
LKDGGRAGFRFKIAAFYVRFKILKDFKKTRWSPYWKMADGAKQSGSKTIQILIRPISISIKVV